MATILTVSQPGITCNAPDRVDADSREKGRDSRENDSGSNDRCAPRRRVHEVGCYTRRGENDRDRGIVPTHSRKCRHCRFLRNFPSLLWQKGKEPKGAFIEGYLSTYVELMLCKNTLSTTILFPANILLLANKLPFPALTKEYIYPLLTPGRSIT